MVKDLKSTSKSILDLFGSNPKEWDFLAKNNKGQDILIHSENGGNSKFPGRWQWWDAQVNAPFAAS